MKKENLLKPGTKIRDWVEGRISILEEAQVSILPVL